MYLRKRCLFEVSSNPQLNNNVYELTHSHSNLARQTDIVFTSHTTFLCGEFSKVYYLYKGCTLEMKFLGGDSPLQFWLGDRSGYLLQIYLQGLKQKMMQGVLCPLESNPKIGELIICRTDTKSIFRGYVVNQDSKTITTINIDTGALHIVTSKDTWQIDGSFFSLPPQAICCKLWQVPNSIKWCRFLEIVFRKLAHCYLTVVLKDLVLEGMFPCFIVDVNATYKNKFTSNLSVWSKYILKRIEIAEMFNFTHGATLYKDLDICVDVEEEEKSSYNGSNSCYSGSMKQIQKHKSEYDIIHTVLYCAIKKGSVFWTTLDLKVGCPWNFFINLVPMKDIEKLKRNISDKGNNGLLTHFPTVPKVGNIAIGKCNDTFSRIRITGFLRFSNMGNVTAIDIDDGTTKILWVKDLWVLDKEFLSPPALMLNCALSKYIQKPAYWDIKLQQIFKEIMTKGILKITVLDMLYISGSFRYIVNIKMYGDCDSDVSDYLLKNYNQYVKKYKNSSCNLFNKIQKPN